MVVGYGGLNGLEFNPLLVHPWIHMAGAVPSTLHQPVKYIINGELVSLAAENGKVKASGGNIFVINLDEIMEPPGFQAFEISTTSYIPLGLSALKPRVAEEVMVKEMIGVDFYSGQGLGKNDLGIFQPIQILIQKTRAGLGYRSKGMKGNLYKKM